MAIAAAAVLIGAVALYLVVNSSAPQLDPTNTAPLERALTQVPSHDTAGQDIPQVPRPGGTVRTYYLSNSAVTTVVYTREGGVPDVRGGIEAGLSRSGWAVVGPAAPPNGGTQRTWQQVYSDGVRVLQVQVFTHVNTVATIYVLQKGKSGQ